MWTYKNDYYAVMIIVYPTHKTSIKKKNKNEEKSRDGSKKKLSNKSSSDGKLIQGDIPTSHLWSQAVTT